MEANAFLEALYNANYERLYIYAENLLFNAAYAEEAVQETFFEAVRKQDALMRHAKPEAWLMETLKNKIRVGSRRRALEALYFISLEQDLAQESKKLAVEDRPFGSINELLDAIRALLPPEDYRLLCRITLEGATHLEVAKELGISVWSSQKRLQRIRKKLCMPLSIIFIVGGAAAIAFGGDLTVDAASRIASDLGMTQTLIGLTIVSIGTSLPELVTSIVAARKNEVDMALGNAIGSNVFNILMVLGIASAISPISIITENIIDLCVLIAFTVCVWIFAGSKKKIGRVEGFCMVALYAAYAVYIIIR